MLKFVGLILMTVSSFTSGLVTEIKLCKDLVNFDGNEICSKEPYDMRQLDVEPKIVETSVDLFGVTDINNNKMTISVAMEIFLSWVDTRLEVTNSYVNGTNSLEWYNVVEDVSDLVWKPPIMFYRIRELKPTPSMTSDRSKTFWMYVPTQTFEFSESLEVTVTCAMDFNLYPFDSHICPLNFGDAEYETESLTVGNLSIFYSGKTTTFGEPDIQMDFTNGAYDIYVQAQPSQVYHQEAKDEYYSFTGLKIKFNRKPSALFGSFYGPTMLFVIVSWLSFAIPVHQVPGRMGLLITLYLIMINTYGNAVSESPDSRGFGQLEFWMVGAQLPIFLAMVEYGYVLSKVKKEHNQGCPFAQVQPLFIPAPPRKKIQNFDAKPPDPKDCCENKRFTAIDKYSLVGSIILFLAFNLIYWVNVSSFDHLR